MKQWNWVRVLHCWWQNQSGIQMQQWCQDIEGKFCYKFVHTKTFILNHSLLSKAMYGDVWSTRGFWAGCWCEPKKRNLNLKAISAIKEGIKTKVSSQKQVKQTMLNLQGNAEEVGSGPEWRRQWRPPCPECPGLSQGGACLEADARNTYAKHAKPLMWVL